MGIPQLIVDAYAGYKGEETPRSFTLDGVKLGVVDVLDRWYSETHSYFRVRASDDQRYVLRYNLDEEVWELVMQEGSKKK
ncbi:MAG TPA: hypothetical protein VKP13_18890 [Nitrospira sp.]|nr:hypothetical protein [Nitrospira sp.]